MPTDRLTGPGAAPSDALGSHHKPMTFNNLKRSNIYILLCIAAFAASALLYFGLKNLGVGSGQRIAILAAIILAVLLIGIVLNKRL